MTKAVKYSIQNLVEEFTIDNKYGYEIYLDKNQEIKLLSFIRKNIPKFIYIIRFVLNNQHYKVYKQGPYCTMEMRFVKNGMFENNKRLNSRIYLIQKNKKLILCYLDLDKKTKKVISNIKKILKNKCRELYEFTNSNCNLIETQSHG